jgi:hypothetical protein
MAMMSKKRFVVEGVACTCGFGVENRLIVTTLHSGALIVMPRGRGTTADCRIEIVS